VAAVRYGQDVTTRVRFAPSPTGSLHLGNALSAVANRTYADAHGGVLVLRIDDTDPARTVAGGEEAILADLAWLGVGWDEGPLRQSERTSVYAAALERALANGAARDEDGSVRLAGTTLARADGSATYQLATVADDLDLGITHVIRGSDHRPNEEVQQRIARALGGALPEVIHHGLLVGEDGKKLSKRAAHASVADLRAEGIPAAAVRAYLEELGLPRHDVRLDAGRIQRLAIDAIAEMPDTDLAAAADAPVELAPALRGARTLVEAGEIARQILSPEPVALGVEAEPTLERFAELRLPLPEWLAEDDARAIVRELKAVGGNLKQLRLALTGAERGPELWAVVASVTRDEALRRAGAAITPR
jgi:glutamyl/glutaminyl-tRNA synthetase